MARPDHEDKPAAVSRSAGAGYFEFALIVKAMGVHHEARTVVVAIIEMVRAGHCWAA